MGRLDGEPRRQNTQGPGDGEQQLFARPGRATRWTNKQRRDWKVYGILPGESEARPTRDFSQEDPLAQRANSGRPFNRLAAQDDPGVDNRDYRVSRSWTRNEAPSQSSNYRARAGREGGLSKKGRGRRGLILTGAGLVAVGGLTAFEVATHDALHLGQLINNFKGRGGSTFGRPDATPTPKPDTKKQDAIFTQWQKMGGVALTDATAESDVVSTLVSTYSDKTRALATATPVTNMFNHDVNGNTYTADHVYSMLSARMKLNQAWAGQLNLTYLGIEVDDILASLAKNEKELLALNVDTIAQLGDVTKYLGGIPDNIKQQKSNPQKLSTESPGQVYQAAGTLNGVQQDTAWQLAGVGWRFYQDSIEALHAADTIDYPDPVYPPVKKPTSGNMSIVYEKYKKLRSLFQNISTTIDLLPGESDPKNCVNSAIEDWLKQMADAEKQQLRGGGTVADLRRNTKDTDAQKTWKYMDARETASQQAKF